jgi:hypothetical protein
MKLDGLINIKKAISTLNPHEVRDSSERSLRVVLHASDNAGFSGLENFLLQDLSPARRKESALLLSRAPVAPGMPSPDLHIYSEEQASLAPSQSLILNPAHPKAFITKTLEQHADLGVPLARSFLPFRKPFVERTIAKTCRENTLFSVATALPDIVPSVIELPWAVAEFASDTAFLTMNQVRMAFLLAAASDREVGYMHQKSEIAMVIGSAFGWRAIARQLIGKIPFGGGLIGKAAVAYAGTKVLGLSLDHYYSIGFTYTREERDRLYADAFRQGKKVAVKMLKFLRPDLAARFAQDGETRSSSRPVVISPEPNLR